MQESIGMRLARHGVVVLLLGLLTGFVIGKFPNRTLGNAAHLTGLIGGFGMIALGMLWPRLQLGRLGSQAGAWMTAGSMYLNWMGLAILGGLGSGPKAAQGVMSGSVPLWGRAGGLMLTAAALLSLLATLVILFGLRRLGGRNEVSTRAAFQN